MESHVLSAWSTPSALPGFRVIEHTSQAKIDIAAIELLDVAIDLSETPTMEAVAKKYNKDFVNGYVAQYLATHQNHIPKSWNGLEISFLETRLRPDTKRYEDIRHVYYIKQESTGFWKLYSAPLMSVLTAVARGETQVRLAVIPRTIH